MSVTFTFGTMHRFSDGEVALVHGIVGCEHKCPTPDTCDDFQVYGYCDHIADAKDVCLCSRHDVNFSNSNAIDILGRLGFDVDPSYLCGSCDADDFMARAMLGTVGHDDTGLRTETHQFPGGPTIVECGRRPGYFADAMDRLADLATVAKAHGWKVAWS